MSATITDGTTSAPLDLVAGYTAARASRSIFHAVIGRAYDDVTLRPLGLRSGTLTLVCAALTTAQAVVDMHDNPTGLLTIQDDESGFLDIDYVVSGSVTVALDAETQSVWVVTVDFQEVVTGGLS